MCLVWIICGWQRYAVLAVQQMSLNCVLTMYQNLCQSAGTCVSKKHWNWHYRILQKWSRLLSHVTCVKKWREAWKYIIELSCVMECYTARCTRCVNVIHTWLFSILFSEWMVRLFSCENIHRCSTVKHISGPPCQMLWLLMFGED